MNKAKIHLQNLYTLIREAGTLSELARRCGYTASASLSKAKSRLEQNAQDGAESTRGLNRAVLLKLESGMGKRKGWMDRVHVETPKQAEQTPQVEAEDAVAEAAGGRTATVTRNTSETQISVSINLDGTGKSTFDTGVPFLEHMLDQISRHGLIDLDITCKGDLHIDDHHTVEDIGITLGQALKQALGDKTGIRRYGMSYVPLDEALSRVVLDLSGRPGLTYNIEFTRAIIGRFDVDLFSEFFHGLVNHSMMTLHIDNLRGDNAHHQAETVFKAFGRALRMAVEFDERMAGKMPSTKGTLTA
ncbi:MAG: imidazoleglycerol-phosphate dehydratase HisB [Neisseria sp.]|nr:imidazoleglycerol-phosphate dehydratase HisB [Neisseria sp.]